MFKSFYKWLKPGGNLLITDYCKKEGPPSPDFQEYIKQRGYDLHVMEAYGQVTIAYDYSHIKHLLICEETHLAKNTRFTLSN